ncbi:hypothetical protein M9458_054110, partial [Cirrhinus mrigala]
MDEAVATHRPSQCAFPNRAESTKPTSRPDQPSSCGATARLKSQAPRNASMSKAVSVFFLHVVSVKLQE